MRGSFTGVAAPLALLFALVSSAAAPPLTSAQTRFRRPYNPDYRLNYGFDNNGGAGGCSDYACMGACYDGHTGSDLGTPFGTEIRAGAAGRVTGRNTGCADYGGLGNTCGGRCGNYIQLEHADGSRTIYCHMRNGSLRVAMGATVACGQVIGESASSGSSTGPHLHFGWKRNATAASDDPYSGRCGGPTSLWVNQRGYREPVGTMCQCSPSTEVCNGADDDCDGTVDENARAETCNGADDDCDGATDEDDVCEIRLLHQQPNAYAPSTTTDVDGDGRGDVCGRGGSGVRCWPRVDGGWGAALPPIPWSDELGWDDVSNFATIRMGDIDGDGRADACARANSSVVCARAVDGGFEDATTWLAGLGDADGWNDPRHYTTLRLADIDGDGSDDLCARGPEGLDCWLSDGARFGPAAVVGPRWADASGWGRARYYGTIRMGDLDGDGRADVCARAAAGIRCHLSTPAGFGDAIAGPAWSNDNGWAAMQYWSTIRLADVDGDGRSELCARDRAELHCLFFDPATESFGGRVTVAGLSDASGWDDESNYASLRVGDVNGDGAEDFCARANAGIRCWAWDGAAFASIVGPALSDAEGWDAPQYYQTLQIVDVDGDGLGDACARGAAGWRCNGSLGDSFGPTEELGDLAASWAPMRYYSTVRSATRLCRAQPELCNGADDDCDGAIDEDATSETCDGLDEDCDGAIDEGDVCGELPGVDAGVVPPRADGSVPPGIDAGGGGTGLEGGCACSASAPSSEGGFAPLGLLGLALLLRPRRRA